MTADVHAPIICGARETRITGTWECVMPHGHGSNHYWVLLISRPEAL